MIMLKYLYVKSQILKTGLMLFISLLIYSLLDNGGFFYETVIIIRKKNLIHMRFGMTM